MRRLALLGNSHLAAWKLGWDEIGESFANISITFFAANGDRLTDFRVAGDRLLITDKSIADLVELTSGGKREIVAADYDAFGIVGLNFGISAVSALYSRWRSDSHTDRSGRFTIVSDDCFQCTVSDILRATPAIDLALKLRSLCRKPIYLGVQPAPSEAVLRLKPSSYHTAGASGDDVLLRKAYQAAWPSMAVDNMIVVDQPASTLASPLFSKEAFQRGRSHVADLTHLNQAYGVVALTAMLSHIDETRAAA